MMQMLVLVMCPQLGCKTAEKPKPATIIMFLNEEMEFRREGIQRERDAAKPTAETFAGDLEKSQTGMGAFAVVSDDLE
jgi:hypothetical protein